MKGSAVPKLQDLQSAYDESANPEITTDATREALTIKQGSGADTDNIIEGQNGAGTNTFLVKGNGFVELLEQLLVNANVGNDTIVKLGANRTADGKVELSFIGNNGETDYDAQFEYRADISELILRTKVDDFRIDIGGANEFSVSVFGSQRLKCTAGEVVINEGGHPNTDFRVEGDTNLNLLVTDAGNESVGINKGATTHDELFHVGGNQKLDGQIYSGQQALKTPTGTTETVDWNSGNSAVIDLVSTTADLTLTLNNPKAGASYFIKFIQGPTARDVILPANVLLPNGSAPNTLNITNIDDAVDVLSLYYDGTNYLGQFTKRFG